MYQVVSTSYGREDLRLLGVRQGSPATARDLRLSMRLEGDFTAAFADGDNADVLPTRSMTNTAAALVHDHLGSSSIEQISVAVAQRLLAACPAAQCAHVAAAEYPWALLPGSHHTFATPPSDLWLANVTARRDQPAAVVSGASGLYRAVTTGSSFLGFLVDEYTLPHQVAAEDRVLHLSGELRWEYAEVPADYDASRAEVLGAFRGAAIDQCSRSWQHAAYLSATAVLDACAAVSEVSMRTVHHAHTPVDLSPFGRRSQDAVWLSTDSSYGAGVVTVRRGTG
ncbi:hypothetical protein ABZ769_23660 [Streptomyces olivoreticuli]